MQVSLVQGNQAFNINLSLLILKWRREQIMIN